MDVHRCDECGVESPDHERLYRSFDAAWWNVSREYRGLGFHFCSWLCVRTFVEKHSAPPLTTVDVQEQRHVWNAKRQEYEPKRDDAPVSRRAGRKQHAKKRVRR